MNAARRHAVWAFLPPGQHPGAGVPRDPRPPHSPSVPPRTTQRPLPPSQERPRAPSSGHPGTPRRSDRDRPPPKCPCGSLGPSRSVSLNSRTRSDIPAVHTARPGDPQEGPSLAGKAGGFLPPGQGCRGWLELEMRSAIVPIFWVRELRLGGQDVRGTPVSRVFSWESHVGGAPRCPWPTVCSAFLPGRKEPVRTAGGPSAAPGQAARWGGTPSGTL